MSVQVAQLALALIKYSVLIQLDTALVMYEDAVASHNIDTIHKVEITIGQVWQAGNAAIKTAELAVKNAENELAAYISSSAQA